MGRTRVKSGSPIGPENAKPEKYSDVLQYANRVGLIPLIIDSGQIIMATPCKN